jgi:hypothetical protein
MAPGIDILRGAPRLRELNEKSRAQRRSVVAG